MSINTAHAFGVSKKVHNYTFLVVVAIEKTRSFYKPEMQRHSAKKIVSIKVICFFLLTFLNLLVSTEALRVMLKRCRYGNFSLVMSFPIISVHY